jgi:uncharacterized protein YbjQ (UPF0145 family)
VLPGGVQRRLAEIGAARPGALSFTSDLAPDEAGLLRRHGWQPICLVTGSCVYHVGIAYASAWNDSEVVQLSRAYGEATARAVRRMGQEAEAVGAHGVVGVRYAIARHEWADSLVEVQLVGTAVRGPDPLRRPPWLCDLSGQQWWSLHRAGYEPAALVYGHCTWFVLTTRDDMWTMQTYRNAELEHFSDALGHCRARATAQLLQQARQVGAVGVVGVHIARRLDEVELEGDDAANPVYGYKHHNLVLSMIGTAVRVRGDAPAGVPATRPVLSLRTGRLSSRVGEVEAVFT